MRLVAPLLVSISVLSFCAHVKAAVLLVGWDFNDSIPMTEMNYGQINLVPDAGVYQNQSTMWLAPTLAGSHGGSLLNTVPTYGAGAGLQHPDGTPAGSALTIIGSSNNNQYLVMEFPTLGYGNLEFSFQAKRYSSGFTSVSVEYAVGNGVFLFVESHSLPATNPTYHLTVDLSAIEELNNQPKVSLRFRMSGLTNPGGTTGIRLDNFRIASVPEPTSALTLLPATLLLRRRRASGRNG